MPGERRRGKPGAIGRVVVTGNVRVSWPACSWMRRTRSRRVPSATAVERRNRLTSQLQLCCSVRTGWRAPSGVRGFAVEPLADRDEPILHSSHFRAAQTVPGPVLQLPDGGFGGASRC